MSIWAVVLVVISALLHAGWNILSKSNKASGSAFFLASSAVASILLAPFVIWYLKQAGVGNLPPMFWWLLTFSGIAQVVYLVGLGHAYKHGDIGVIYPIARALPVLMVGVGTVVIGYQLSPMDWFGFGLITFGCLIVPLDSFKQMKLKSYANLGVLWAFIAALGTTGYSILDKEALSLINQALSDSLESWQSAIFFLGIQFWAILIVISVYLFCTKQFSDFSQAWEIRKACTMAGIMMSTTYGLVLIAMTMTENVSYVVALRQLSIVFGVVMGIVWLKEKWALTRGVGTGMIFIGLIATVF